MLTKLVGAYVVTTSAIIIIKFMINDMYVITYYTVTVEMITYTYMYVHMCAVVNPVYIIAL